MCRLLPPAPAAPPGSLSAALAATPDPRRTYGRREAYPPIPRQAAATDRAPMLCGACTVCAIAQWGRHGWRVIRSSWSGWGQPPWRGSCVATMHRVCKALDVGTF
jgi:hypothetical protein